MSDRPPAERSPAPQGFGLLWAAPRGALRPRLIAPAWLFFALLAGAEVALEDSSWAWVLWPAAGLGGLLGACWVSVLAVRDLCPVERPSWTAHAALALRAFGCSFFAGAAYGLAVALLAAVAASTLLLRWIPFAGQALYTAGLLTMGLGAALLAAFLLVAAPLFFPLLAPCAAAETSRPVAAFMTCWSYVRRRPLRCLLGQVCIALSTMLALIPAALVLALAAGGLRSIHVLGEGAAGAPADLAADAA
ncbi:MAG: hypothetical protein JXA90_05245, partial [Planctomycetes bacterium]|nr:hypothetical protein [Planctomycetota bacterium]